MIKVSLAFSLFLFLSCKGQTENSKDNNTSISKMKNVVVYDNLLINDTTAKNYFIQGLNALNFDGYADAKKCFSKANEIEENNPIILNGLANVINKLGDSLQAETLYIRSIAIDSNYIISYVNYGNYLRQRHQLEKAKNILLQGFKFNPNDQEKTGLYYNLASVNLNMDKCDEAQECATKAQSSTPNQAEKEDLKRFVQEIKTLCKH